MSNMKNAALTIENVVRTLDCVEVHGEKNLNALLACIQTLKQVIVQLNETEEAVKE